MFQVGFFCGIFACITAANPNKTQVTVLYSSMNEASRTFLLNQLFPVINSGLSDYINLELIPYGNTIESPSEEENFSTFVCEHGENECYLNKMEACVAHFIPNITGLNLMECLTKELNDKSTLDDIEEKSRLCEVKNNIVADFSKDCANNKGISNVLMKNLANITSLTVDFPKNLPVVVLNQKFNDTENSLAKQDLKKLICSLHNNKPANCFVIFSKKLPPPGSNTGEVPNEVITTTEEINTKGRGTVNVCYTSAILVLLAILSIH